MLHFNCYHINLFSFTNKLLIVLNFSIIHSMLHFINIKMILIVMYRHTVFTTISFQFTNM